VRRILRNRSRYEVANNSYAKGIVLTIADAVIGTGPRLQIQTSDPQANRRIESEFMNWSSAVRLPEKLRTMRLARSEDGEAFGILTNNPQLPTSVKLDLRLVEADQVATPEFSPLGASGVDGIVIDKFGNPVEYHVLKRHPGEAATRDYDRLPAESVLHWFRMDRPGQARGIPELTPAISLFAQLRRFNLAVLAAAETAADFAGILYTDAPAGGEADAAEPFEPIELEKRALLTMPGGWRMEQMRAEQPATTHETTVRVFMREICRCLGVPLSIALGDSSGMNYASGRLDHQGWFKTIRVEQSHLACVLLDRILAAWFDEAVLIRDLIPTGVGPIIEFPRTWMFDGHEHVDPAKESSAQATRLASHTTTLADEYARRGLDWESQLRQRAKEVALMNELGLSATEALPASGQEERETEDESEAQPTRRAA
jgi:lambda family phage portal protein